MKFVSIAVLLMLAACSKPAPLPVLGQVPGFTLTAESGQPFDRKSLDGKVWVADFIYTTCPGPCPRMSSLMRQVQKASVMIPGVQLVSFTVDPEHDTPAVLAAYLRHFDPSFLGITGDPGEIRRLAGSLGVGITRVTLPGGGYDFDHTMAILLFDSGAREVGVFTPPFDVRQLTRSLRGVAPELRAAA